MAPNVQKVAGSSPTQPGGLLFGETVGSIAVSEKDAAGSKCMPGGALVTNWATQIPSIGLKAMSVSSSKKRPQLGGRGRHSNAPVKGAPMTDVRINVKQSLEVPYVPCDFS
jgi:hypothetical protein